MKGFYYEQRSGTFGVVNHDFDCPLFEGYSGRGVCLNDPDAEDIVGQGPIPKGVYRLRLMAHRRFKAPAFFCDPDEATREVLREYGRSGFWIHGDNAAGNRTASHGCIILAASARQSVVRLMENGFDHLRVIA